MCVDDRNLREVALHKRGHSAIHPERELSNQGLPLLIMQTIHRGEVGLRPVPVHGIEPLLEQEAQE
jgi:hypothetical protein